MNRNDAETLKKLISGEWVIAKESFMPETSRKPLPRVAPTAPPPVSKDKESSKN